VPLTTEISDIQVDPQILSDIKEEAQVIVHCSFYNDSNVYAGDMGLRVWKETFLIDEATGLKVPMIKALGIVYQPDWYFLVPGETKRFTLIFEALPKSCVSFTLVEIINQPGAFMVTGILRNNSDIYHARLD